jgi:hypothetical protein
VPNDKPQITFKYIFTYDYNPEYVNGAHGGVSPRGELVVNFYLERPPLPNSVSHEITPTGAIGPEATADPADLNASIVRYVSTGVVLSLQTARELHGWLGDKIRELETLELARTAHADAAKNEGQNLN